MRIADMIGSVVALGQSCRFDLDHASRVSRLALRLFDQLQPLHEMGNTERIWLRAAALLHDVAKPQDPKDHHKVARDLILHAASLPFRAEERTIIALVARYHRGSLPEGDHACFRDLDAESQLYVAKLASLLRLADGLDEGRAGLVDDVFCQIRPRCVLLRALSRDTVSLRKVLRKADLFGRTFGRDVVVGVEIVPAHLDLGLDSKAAPAYAAAR
ncbi:HD domain-containing protein [Anaerobaca lacustris]|uniref:HD domain-containing protein n=1 Tax=Anaerobaca lacustris TaxID=3044600 RepID=A0AAW6TQK5_9BACT|nr:HD domain-containing protein [Sedimentisphaerales bacterium M17dextr]